MFSTYFLFKKAGKLVMQSKEFVKKDVKVFVPEQQINDMKKVNPMEYLP